MKINKISCIFIFIILSSCSIQAPIQDYFSKATFQIKRQINMLKFSKDQQILVAMNRNDKFLSIYNCFSYQLIQQIQLDFTPIYIAVSSKASYLGIISSNGSFIMLARRRILNQDNAINQNSKLQFQFNTNIQKPFNIDLTKNLLIKQNQNAQSNEIQALVQFSQDEDMIAIANGKGTQIDVYNITVNGLQPMDMFSFVSSPIKSLSWGAYSDYLLVAGGIQPDMDLIVIYRYVTDKFKQIKRTTDYGVYATFSPFQNSILVSGDSAISTNLYLLNPINLAKLQQVNMGEANLISVQISKDELTISASRQQRLNQSNDNQFLQKIMQQQNLKLEGDGIFSAIRVNSITSFTSFYNTTSSQTSASILAPSTNDLILTQFNKKMLLSARCPNGTLYIANQCTNCPVACDFCSSSTQCQKCDDIHYLSTDKRCALCIPPCKSCSSLTKCLSCIDGYHVNDDLFCSEDTFPIWAVIVIMIGVLIILGVVGFAVFLILRMKKKSRKEPLLAQQKQ